MRYTLSHTPLPVWFIVSGVFMGAAFTRWYLWWLVFFGLVLFIWSLTRVRSVWRAFFLGWLAGMIKMLLVYVWILTIYPLAWAGMTPFNAGILTGAYWLLFAVAIGFGFGLIGVCFVQIRQWNLHVPILLFPGLLLVGEIVGARLFAVITLGPGGSLVSLYTHGYSGLTLVDHMFLKWFAVFGGAYALTLVAGLVSTLLFWVAKRIRTFTTIQNVGIGFFVFAFVLLGFITPTFFYKNREQGSGKFVAVVSTIFDREMLTSGSPIASFIQHQQLSDAVTRAAEYGVTAIILPESSHFGEGPLSEEEILELLKKHAPGDVVLVDSVRGFEGAQEVLRAVTYDTKSGQAYRYDKQHLVAFGEYVPYLAQPFFDQGAANGAMQEIANSAAFVPGIPRSMVGLPLQVPSVVFCGDVGIPWAMKQAVLERGDAAPAYIAYTASHAWFAGGSEPVSGWNQIDRMLKAHALWSGKHIVEAANMAPSAHYKPDGTLGELTPIYQNTHVRVDIVEI